jgi:hypothetical protein
MVETHPEKRIIGYARVSKAHNLRMRARAIQQQPEDH